MSRCNFGQKTKINKIQTTSPHKRKNKNPTIPLTRMAKKQQQQQKTYIQAIRFPYREPKRRPRQRSPERREFRKDTEGGVGQRSLKKE